MHLIVITRKNEWVLGLVISKVRLRSPSWNLDPRKIFRVAHFAAILEAYAPYGLKMGYC